MRNEVEELGAPGCVERHGSDYFYSAAIIAVKKEIIQPSFTTRSAAADAPQGSAFARTFFRSGLSRPAVVLLTPILLPLASQLGIDPVHYGAVIVATQGISVFLPPVGVSLLVTCSVGGVEPAEVARPLLPYLALMLALTLVIAFLPDVVLFLPNLLGY